MNIKWTVWSAFYFAGFVFVCTQAQENTTATDPTTNDYDPNYSDYPDRDYPNLDYYDDGRDGRSLDNGYSHHGDSENDAQEYADDFMIKQLRSTIPGEPGVDYGLYQSVPDTSFRCESQRSPGFYGDVEAQCQVFHICQDDDRQDSFLCPIGTVFNQISFICDWWFNFQCEDTPTHFHLNHQFHSSSGFTSMKDTMSKMRNVRHRKNMNAMMGLKKMDRKSFHDRHQSTRNVDSMKRNMSPKVRNLFMLRMRMDKLRRGRNKETSQQLQDYVTDSNLIVGTQLNDHDLSKYQDTTKMSAENVLTTSTLPIGETTAGTEIVKTMGSTGYVDVSVSENMTTANTSFEDYNTSTYFASDIMNVSDSPSFVTKSFHGSVLDALHSPLKSLLNLPGLEMIINGSIVTTVKLDQVHSPVIETSTIQHYLDVTEELSSITEEKVKQDDKEHVKEKNELEYQHVNNQSIYIPSDAETDKSQLQNQISNNLSNITISNATEPSEKPTTVTSSFNHKNNFIIGNDTHISVSVTIHSKSGRSRLQWKRLPGIKRIRKIRFKNAEDYTDTRKSSINETTFKKRIYGEKPMSRVMWIPAKNNVLERRRDWKSVESITYDSVAEINVSPFEENLKKSALEMHSIPSINVPDMSLRQEMNITSTEFNSPELSVKNSTLDDNLTDDSNTAYTTDNLEAEFFPSNHTDIISQTYESQKVYNYDINSTQTVKSNETDEIVEFTSNLPDKSTDKEDNCKTICIKLLRSLHSNSSAPVFKNSTRFEDTPNSLTLFDHESLESHRTPEFDRKSVLGISPSEQWTVKYDPGPDCNENTDDDKVLIKGWSVIIDTGSVTKEKTVKRRRCTTTLNDNRFIMMKGFNTYRDSKDSNNGGVNFNSESSQIHSNPKINGRSMDQRYWLNLVKNWLESSPSSVEQGYNSRKKDGSKTFSNVDSRMDKSSYSNYNRYHSALQNSRHNRPKDNFPNDSRRTIIPNKHKRQNPEVRRIRDKKPDSSSDLQAERSDWSQATQRSSDWSKSQNKNPTRDTARDWDSDTDEYPQPENRRQSSRSFDSHPSIDFRNTRNSRDFDTRKDWASRDDSIEDWSSKMEHSSNDWDKSVQDNRKRQSQNKDWSNEFQKWQDKMPSKSNRNDWTSEISSDIPENNNRKGFATGVSKPKGRSGSKDGTRMNDWSSESSKNRAQRGSRRTDETSWQRRQENSDSADKVWKSNRDPRDQVNNKGSSKGPQRSRPSLMKDKGRSSSEDWNWSSDEGNSRDVESRRSNRDRSARDRNDSSNRQNRKGGDTNVNQMSWRDWNSMKSGNADWSSNKKNPRKGEDRISQRPKGKPDISSRPIDNKRDWASDESNDWSKDWKMDRDRKGDSWEEDRNINKGQTLKDTSNWNSDEMQDWPVMEQRNFKSSINENPKVKHDKSPDLSTDWSSRSHENRRDWNTGTRESGNRDRGIDFKPGSSRRDTDWKNDPKPQSSWSHDDRSISSSHSQPSLGQKNKKGNIDSDFRRSRVPMSTQKSWDLNPRKDWTADEKRSTDSFARDSRPQKGNADDFSQPKRGIPQWKSDFLDSQEWSSGLNKGQDKSKDSAWDSSEDYFDGSSKDDYDWNSRKKMEYDWSFQPDIQPNRMSFSKEPSKGEMRPTISDGWNKDVSSAKSFDEALWSSSGPSSKGSSKGSQKGRMKASGGSWESSKGADGSSRKPEVPSPNKGDPQSNPKQSWKNESTSPKNASNSKGDSEMKKIVWSVQISSDGKTGSGWVPITLRPELKGKENGTQNNKESSTKDEDWPSEERKGEDWISKNGKGEDWPSDDGKSEDWSSEGRKSADWSSEKRNEDLKEDISQFSETSSAQNFDVGTETNPSTSNLPEASFSHLFYIPTSNSRYKRDYGGERRRRLQSRNSSTKPYKVIKSGEILNDALRNSNDANRFFLAKAAIVVGDNRIPRERENLIHFTLKKLLDQEVNDSSFHNFKPSRDFSAVYNHARKTRNDTIKASQHWDTLTKESTVRERWSPFYSSNFSASGWIPVNTLTARNFNERNSSIFLPSINSNRRDDRIDKVSKHANFDYQLVDDRFQRNISQSPSLNTTVIYTEFSPKDKSFASSTDDITIRKEENGTEMKVGNKTLRILSFSDIMKQFNISDKPQHKSQGSVETWNAPITSAPKMYSLKLVDPSVEKKENGSNSWSFSAANGTKQAWILVEKNNATNNSAKDVNTSDIQVKPTPNDVTEYKIIVGNRTSSSDTNNGNLNSSNTDNKGHYSNEFLLKLNNFRGESDWRPVVTAIGRVVPFNRTLTKGSIVK